METSLLKKGFWGNLILLSSLLIITLTFGYSKLPTNFKTDKSTLASISSDKADYQPGDTLRLSGTGFLPGETVTLHFDETPTVCPNGHNRSTIADSNGNIFYDQFYFNINHVGVAFVVTATGQSSGIIAQTTFTDANTALTSPSPTTAVYGSTITISSTLTQQGGNAGCSLCVGNGNPIPNRTLAFSVNGGTSLGSGVTNSSGVGSSTAIIALNVGAYNGGNGLKVSFAGDSTPYAAQSATVNFSVTKATSSISAVSGSGIYGSSATLTATVNLNVAGLPINFSLDGTSVGSANTNASGVATLVVPFASIPSSVRGANTWTGKVVAGIANTANYSATNASGNLVIGKLDITGAFTASDKIYNGDNSASVLTRSLNGVLAGDNANVSLSGGTASFADANAGAAKIVTLVDASLTGSAAGNYNLTSVSTTTANIAARPITVTADAKSKTYGDADPSLTYQITQGSLAFSDTFSGNLSRVPGENVGPYGITQGSLTLGSNYDLSFVGADLTIGQRAIEVTADAKSKTYGDADPAFTYQITQGSLAFSDAFSGNLSRVAGENVGPYGITQGSLTLGSNYDLSFVGADLTIGQRAIEVTADAKSKTYGDADPAFTYQITQGSLAFSDAFSGNLSRVAGENVGPYGITQGSLTLGSNYDLSFVGADLTIGQRAIEVTADAKSKTYGDADPAFTYQITQGSLAFSDAFSGSLSRVAGENVGPYGITQGSLTLGSNYDLSFVGADLTIGQRAVEVMADAKSKTYGDADPAFTYQITQGSLAFSDAFSGSLSRVAGENVGPYGITQGSLTLGSNYDLSYVGADLTIGQRVVEVTADAKSKTYGDADPAFTYQITQGSLAFSDAFSGSLSRVAGENVGPYGITQGSLTLGSNYDLSFVGADLTIGQRAVEVMADAKSKTYGDADPAFTYQITQGSLAFSDAFSGSLSRVAGENVGPYGITQGSLTLGSNYDLSYVGADLTIGQRVVEVTADAKSKTYGDADPAFTYQITQGSLAFSDAFSGSLSRVAGENVGPYGITQGSLTLGSNYDLSFVGADLTIGQRAVEVTADAKSKTYGDADPAFTYQITQGSLAFSDAFSGSLSRVAGENVGPYGITQGSLTLGSNYDLSFVGADLTIGQRAVEVTADAKSKTYGDADPAFTYQITQGSLAFSDAFSGSLSRVAGENVGPYGITQGSLTLGSNYDLSFVGADLTIGQRAVEVTADAKSKTYGDSDPTFTYQITQGSLAFSDAFSGNLSRVPGENIGPYGITQGTLTLGSNYDLSFVGADLTIGQRAIEVTADVKSKVFGDADPVLTYAITNGSLAFSDSFVGNLTRISGEAIGSYAIQKGTLSLGGNYNLSYVGANLNIIGLPLAATVAKTDVSCNGLSNGSISISNPSGGLSGVYEYRLNSGAWQLSGNFSSLSANSYSVQIRDAAHPSFIVVLCTKIINEPALLSASCTNTNNVLYYGYTGDQTSTITVNPSGGVGPYTVSITMNRPLMCNVITNSGDEIWTPGANTMTSSNTNVTCMTSGSFGANQNPSSTSNNTIVTSLGYSLNVSLMVDATFAITVTDQNGCAATCSSTIMAEDVRCFAGNSGVAKVMLCHKTNSSKNPCVSICVDNTAVAEHLAHGDFFGKCTSTCAPSGANGKPEVVFDVKAYPNPSNNQFTFEIESESTESTDITVFDIAGRMVKQLRNRESDTVTFGEELPRGVYLAVIEQGSNRKTVRIVKE